MENQLELTALEYEKANFNWGKILWQLLKKEIKPNYARLFWRLVLLVDLAIFWLIIYRPDVLVMGWGK